jgi:hypothetical protein
MKQISYDFNKHHGVLYQDAEYNMDKIINYFRKIDRYVRFIEVRDSDGAERNNFVRVRNVGWIPVR